MYPAVPFPCLSNGNYSVIAVPSGLILPGNMPPGCDAMKTITVAGRWNVDVGVKVELTLLWFTPYCRSCELEGRGCGLKNDDGQIVCHGSSRGKVSRSY